MRILIFLLSLTGLWISVYFTGVYYKWFQPDVKWIPQVCRLDEKSCLNVLATPRAKLFGVPNSAFGMCVYSFLIIGIFLPVPGWTILSLLLISAALLRSVYLAYSLIFVTKISCPLCFTTHAINLTLFLLLLKCVIF